jgi:fatty acid desaturase
MKTEELYERRQAADRMEAVMFATAAIGVFAAAFSFFFYGWLASLTLLLLSAIAFALARVFDLLAELLAEIGRAKNEFSPPAQDAKKS